eukprot:COSAG05_NODE_1910_length_3845_cov_2.662306_3_plen_284_part_00
MTQSDESKRAAPGVKSNALIDKDGSGVTKVPFFFGTMEVEAAPHTLGLGGAICTATRPLPNCVRSSVDASSSLVVGGLQEGEWFRVLEEVTTPDGHLHVRMQVRSPLPNLSWMPRGYPWGTQVLLLQWENEDKRRVALEDWRKEQEALRLAKLETLERFSKGQEGQTKARKLWGKAQVRLLADSSCCTYAVPVPVVLFVCSCSSTTTLRYKNRVLWCARAVCACASFSGWDHGRGRDSAAAAHAEPGARGDDTWRLGHRQPLADGHPRAPCPPSFPPVALLLC